MTAIYVLIAVVCAAIVLPFAALAAVVGAILSALTDAARQKGQTFRR